MNYLKLETCQLLQAKGCVSESDNSYYQHAETGRIMVCNDEYVDDVLTGYFRIEQAFTWDDICTKENAIKIWGDEKSESWHYKYNELHRLLEMKLNGEDWEAELVKALE